MSDPLLGRATAADRGTDSDGEISKVIEFRLSGNLTGGHGKRKGKERKGKGHSNVEVDILEFGFLIVFIADLVTRHVL